MVFPELVVPVALALEGIVAGFALAVDPCVVVTGVVVGFAPAPPRVVFAGEVVVDGFWLVGGVVFGPLPPLPLAAPADVP